MKYPRTILCAAASLACIAVSCLSPRAKQILASAAPLVVEISKAAEASGKLPPGSAVLFQNGTAIVTSSDTQEQKLMALKEIGLEAAVKEGLIKEGDKLLVDKAGEALVKIISTAEAAAQAPPASPLLPAP